MRTNGEQFSMFILCSTHPRGSNSITYEFGKQIDTYFHNLEPHDRPDPLTMNLKNSGFGRN